MWNKPSGSALDTNVLPVESTMESVGNQQLFIPALTASFNRLLVPQKSSSSLTPSLESSTPTSTPPVHDGGMSHSSEIGIGVGVGVGVLALVLTIGTIYFFLRRRRQRQNQKLEGKDGDGVAIDGAGIVVGESELPDEPLAMHQVTKEMHGEPVHEIADSSAAMELETGKVKCSKEEIGGNTIDGAGYTSDEIVAEGDEAKR
jgi:hypothetical protein